MLLVFTAAFLSGLVLGSYVPYLPLTSLLTLAGMLVTLSVLEYRRRLQAGTALLVYAALLAGSCYWIARGPVPADYVQTDREVPIQIHGTVIEPVRHGPERLVIVLQTDPSAMQQESATVRATWRHPDREILRGHHVLLTARLRAPSGTLNPGGFDYGDYLHRASIDFVTAVAGPGAVQIVNEEGWNPWTIIDHWRSAIRQAAEKSMDSPALGVFLGMIIGEPGYIPPQVRDQFMATGTVHILSISGSHLGLIAVLTFFTVKRACRALPPVWLLRLSRHITATRLAAIVTLVPVTFYTFLAGAEIATVRSFIMIALFLLTVWLGREQQLLATLSMAALLIVLHDPVAVFDISFQLSFLSVLAIALVLLGRPHDDPLETFRSARIRRWLEDYVWMTVGVTLLTLPLAAYYFNQIAWLGLAANLIAVPSAGFVLVPLGLASAVATLVMHTDVLVGAALNQMVLNVFCDTVAALGRLPGAVWHVPSPPVLTIVAYYLLLAVAHWSSRYLLRALGTASVMLLIAWWSWSPHRVADDAVRVTFLDVGQGDAAVIELPDGSTILIDGGASYDSLDMGRTVVAPFLWDRGVRRLDYVIATHPQIDHVGGLTAIVQQFAIGEYWDNGMGREQDFYRRLEDALQSRSISRRVASAGDVIVPGGACQLVVLNPPQQSSRGAVQTMSGRSGGSVLNNFSVVVRLDCGQHSFLFTGDIEFEAIARLRRSTTVFEAEVIKVPHHGARSSLDADWIRIHPPHAAIISVGRHNPYGHPAAMVLDAYGLVGLSVLRTDRHGAVWFTAKIGSPALETHRTVDFRPRSLDLTDYRWGLESENLSRLLRQWAELL